MRAGAREPAVRVRLSPSTEVVLSGSGRALLIRGSAVFALSDREASRFAEETERYDRERRGETSGADPS